MKGVSIGKNVVYIVVAVLVAGAVIYFSQYGNILTTSATETRQSSVTVSSQALVGDEIVVGSLYLDKPGYVVVHKETDDKPGAVIGNSELISGEVTNLRVRINATQAGTKVFVMLHYDDDNDGVYGFPDEDKPVVLEGNVVVKPLSITQGGTHPTQQETTTITGTVTATKDFTIEADDNGFYRDGGKINSITANKGEKVKIIFKFLDANIYFGGLDVRSPQWATVQYTKGSGSTERSVEFTADSTFTFSSYWPATNNLKASGQVVVV